MSVEVFKRTLVDFFFLYLFLKSWKKMLEDIYNTSLDELLEWQENFRKCVDFAYNLNGKEEYKEQSIYSCFWKILKQIL